MSPDVHGTGKGQRYSRRPKIVFDYVAVGLDPGEEQDPDLIAVLTRVATEQIVGQYKHRKPMLTIHPMEWTLASTVEEVMAVQPAHDCDECRGGNLKAAAWLEDHPGQWIALGNLRYTERWPKRTSG